MLKVSEYDLVKSNDGDLLAICYAVDGDEHCIYVDEHAFQQWAIANQFTGAFYSSYYCEGVNYTKYTLLDMGDPRLEDRALEILAWYVSHITGADRLESKIINLTSSPIVKKLRDLNEKNANMLLEIELIASVIQEEYIEPDVNGTPLDNVCHNSALAWMIKRQLQTFLDKHTPKNTPKALAS